MHYKFFLFALAFMYSGMVLSATRADAQETPDFKQLLVDKTWWAENNLDRFYFGQSGEFLQQFAKDTPPYAAGEILKGQWSLIDNNQTLCWTYTSDNRPSDQDFCHQVTLSDAQRPWGKFDDTIILSITENQNAFLWNRWQPENLLLQEEIAQNMQENVAEVKKASLFLNKGNIENYYPFNKETPVFQSMKQYLNDITDQIFNLPLISAYQTMDGDMFIGERSALQKIIANEKRQNDNKYLKDEGIGASQWVVLDNIHCWVYDNRNVCNYIIPASELYDPRNGYIQILDDGFIRHIQP